MRYRHFGGKTVNSDIGNGAVSVPNPGTLRSLTIHSSFKRIDSKLRVGEVLRFVSAQILCVKVRKTSHLRLGRSEMERIPFSAT